jgi:hypothetical protein
VSVLVAIWSRGPTRRVPAGQRVAQTARALPPDAVLLISLLSVCHSVLSVDNCPNGEQAGGDGKMTVVPRQLLF